MLCELKSLNYGAYVFDFTGILGTIILFLGKFHRVVTFGHAVGRLTPRSIGARQNKIIVECYQVTVYIILHFGNKIQETCNPI